MPGKNPSQTRPYRSEQFMVHAMDTWGSSVYLVALGQTRSASDAQDVSQDVFLRLLTSDVPFNDEEHEKAWLLRVTVNRCRELRRAFWRRRVESVGDVEQMETSQASTQPSDAHRLSPDPAEESLSRLESNELWQAMRRLPDKLRVVTLLFYVEEYQTEQIARIVGCRPATVRSRLNRARARLRAELEPEETEEDHGQEDHRRVSQASQERQSS